MQLLPHPDPFFVLVAVTFILLSSTLIHILAGVYVIPYRSGYFSTSTKVSFLDPGLSRKKPLNFKNGPCIDLDSTISGDPIKFVI